MRAVRTVEEKESTLKERQEEQRKLGKHIDGLIAKGQVAEEGEAIGCSGSGICPMLGRGAARVLGISRRVSAVSTQELKAVAPAQMKRCEGAQVTRAVFGMAPSKKKTPQSKLAAAAASMKQRVESLECRAAQSRKSAQELMKAGNKAAAVRELKRSKALEKQALSTQGAMDALEAQSDMLEQTALQKEVAAAIGATAATLKKDKGLISKAEDAVDAASEMRDMHDDLTQVMAGLGDAASNDFDEDELMQELEGMVLEEAPEADEATQEAVAEEKRRREYEELEQMRQQFPTAPKRRVAFDKQSLLSNPSPGS